MEKPPYFYVVLLQHNRDIWLLKPHVRTIAYADLSAADSEHEEELVALVQRLSHVIGRNSLPIKEKPHLGSRIALFTI
jgi:hypothetical protein